jgi:hypothetical protein
MISPLQLGHFIVGNLRVSTLRQDLFFFQQTKHVDAFQNAKKMGGSSLKRNLLIHFNAK